MRRATTLARYAIGLIALATALLTFGTASMTTTVAAPSVGGGTRVVADNDLGKMKSGVAGATEDGRSIKAGKFTPESFFMQDGALMVTGTLEGVIPKEGRFSEVITTTVESANGVPLTDSGDARAMNLAAAQDCDVLNLVLGPLDLNLLGLEVHLDTVVLDIVAVPGAGNLLGNLLCTVAGLLDPAGPLEGLLTQLTGLLQQILGALNLGL